MWGGACQAEDQGGPGGDGRYDPNTQGAAPCLALWFQLLSQDGRPSSAPKSWQAVPWRTCGASGGVCCICFWAEGSVWAPGQAGVITGALPLPHHLLAICLREPSSPLPPPVPVMEWDWASWLGCCCQTGPGLRCGQPASDCLKCWSHRLGFQQLVGMATSAWFSSHPLTAKGPVRGFLEGEENAVWGGIRVILKQSNTESLLEGQCVEWKLQYSLSRTFIEHIFCSSPHANCFIFMIAYSVHKNSHPSQEAQ